MAICGNCGAVTARVRSRWIKGQQLPDECPQCAPGQFEAIKSVRDGQIAMGWEYMPQMYRKTDNGYVAKDELLADTENEILTSIRDSEDNQAYERALATKRQNRRTKALSSSEIEMAVTRWNNAAQA